MSVRFEIPEWLVAQSAPPPSPPVDDHRVESLVNGFIAGKQDALFDAPDAYYRQQGRDAVDGAPAEADRARGYGRDELSTPPTAAKRRSVRCKGRWSSGSSGRPAAGRPSGTR